MTFASDLADRAAALAVLIGADVDPQDLTTRVSQLTDSEAVAVAEASAALMRSAELAQVASVGVIATRSTRESGQSGLAQTRGHRTAISLVQELTGAAKSDAARKVRVGESLVTALDAPDVGGSDGAADAGGADAGAKDHGPDGVAPIPLWDAPLRVALLAQSISTAQHDAIRQGLGEPPKAERADIGDGVTSPESAPDAAADADAVAADAAIREAWSLAAEQLIDDAQARSVEELRNAARAVRDQLDPEGARRRYLQRYAHRSFRLWIDADGNRRGSILFDDDGGLLVQTVYDSGLRPRRGGPRFVDSAERERAARLTDDERTNDQLAYDLFLDVLRAGAFADAESVFGTRQAGVRLVQVLDDAGKLAPTGHAEHGLTTVPSAAVEQHICDSGFVPVTVDSSGNSLDVGREHRLFTPKQRVGLAVRDGGCRWPGCDRPASYCEAHHCDHWTEHEGRTDIDRGILLCRFHHMNLHHHGWRLTRDGKEDFVLHPPPGRGNGPIDLRPRIALTYAWAGIDPPPRRFRTAV